MNWDNVVKHVNETMHIYWDSLTSQQVRVWSLPSPTRDLPNLPDILGLTRGDVILSINNVPVMDEKHCRALVANSGHIMTFTVRDQRDGTVWLMETTLRNGQTRFGAWLEDAPGGGARVAHIGRLAPASRNRVLDVVSGGDRPPPHHGAQPSTLSLSHGDVILSINGRNINDCQQCLDAVRDSGETMEFTVRDSRDGTVWRMKTTLRSTGQRFGIEVDDAPGGGASVTSVEDGYPATRNTVLDKVDDAGHGPTDGHTNWSAPKYHPEVGDRIIGVNGQRISNMQDFVGAVRSSPA
jgi:S1-C subfamily serine protease